MIAPPKLGVLNCLLMPVVRRWPNCERARTRVTSASEALQFQQAPTSEVTLRLGSWFCEVNDRVVPARSRLFQLLPGKSHLRRDLYRGHSFIKPNARGKPHRSAKHVGYQQAELVGVGLTNLLGWGAKAGCQISCVNPHLGSKWQSWLFFIECPPVSAKNKRMDKLIDYY